MLRDSRFSIIKEIKHSAEVHEAQSKHLENPEFCDYINNCVGVIRYKAVLYTGDTDTTTDIPRISVKDFLIALYNEARSKESIDLLKLLNRLTDRNHSMAVDELLSIIIRKE